MYNLIREPVIPDYTKLPVSDRKCRWSEQKVFGHFMFEQYLNLPIISVSAIQMCVNALGCVDTCIVEYPPTRGYIFSIDTASVSFSHEILSTGATDYFS